MTGPDPECEKCGGTGEVVWTAYEDEVTVIACVCTWEDQ